MFPPILFYHAVEDFKVTGRNRDQLKTNVVNKRVKWIDLTPLTPCYKYHVRLMGHFVGQLHAESKIRVGIDWLPTVQLEPARTDIHQMTNKFLGSIIN